jgi:hypothetical protein
MLNKTRIPLALAWIRSAVIILFLTGSNALFSQSNINSPYSMFGPGQLPGNEYFRNLGMGGISQGFRSNTSVNYLNPASYTATDSLSFIFDGTVFSHIYQQQIADLEQTTLYANLGSLNFAFPVTRRWSVAAGVLPWSQLGYSIADSQQDDIVGNVNYFYEGSGGINQVYIGNAIRLFEGLSLGVNASYMFGRSEDQSTANSDSIGFYRTTWSYSDDIRGFMFTYGLQWQIPLNNENSSLTLGATYTGATNLDVKQNRFIIRTLAGVPGVDTLNATPDNNGTMKIPDNIAAGAFISLNNHWGMGLDYQTQSWSQYESVGRSFDLNDAWQVRFGTIYNPRVETYSGLFSRLEYRAGLRYGQSYLKLPDNSGNLQDFSELGISFGISIPVRRSLSGLNIGFEYAQRNPNSEDLINENYFKFNIGINVHERWFIRRKFY